MTNLTAARGTMGEVEQRGNAARPLTHHSRTREGDAVKATHDTRRFWAKVEKTDTCWLWTGSDNGRGYGHLVVRRRDVYAHRYAYELLVGPIPEGLEIDHLCRVRNCVNPAHLEPVTPLENMRRAAALTTHCPAGHAYDEGNTHLTRLGRRRCRTCHRTREAARRTPKVHPPLTCSRCGCTFERKTGSKGPNPTRCPTCHREARRERQREAWQQKHANPAEAVARGFTIQRRSA